jgi:hypothetical protein
VTTVLKERPQADVHLADAQGTIVHTASVRPPAPSIDSTRYFYGTALGWSELGVFAQVSGEQSPVSHRPRADR